MSTDRPTVAPEPRRNADGTTSVRTSDGGTVRVACPTWCFVEHGYTVPPAKAEITHRSEPVWALVDTPEHGPTSLVEVSLVQWPYSDRDVVFLGVETDDGFLEVGPTGARRIAAALRGHAAHIDLMAAELVNLRAGEGQ
ncbi:hypothetical protein G6W61_28010 [Streptomyces sp. KAI-26]|uniref:DUF6907 domain-containing protein n=1 Tax=Streptomyces sp. KAI-26 TaxID=1169747 RepID=UPI001586FC4B|nr:hypothetical protein [Streptomyces sp. KAI-26]NUV90009.1 hypothetical protein [Streptomyces sp. KAI-26]NUW24023.1 hypothetical protein [Streptomyces roseoviolaceus]